ncbi:MAG: TlpA family protein disulfide reductase, partial [Polyangiaceae bacterium]|nr:TlpA family protein disulfide reductase [Polyangiaceae bacterium]
MGVLCALGCGHSAPPGASDAGAPETALGPSAAPSASGPAEAAAPPGASVAGASSAVEPSAPPAPGEPVLDRTLAPGTLRVHLARGADALPGVVVHVVGIGVDTQLEDRAKATDAHGDIELAGLATDGSVAYHLLALAVADRFESVPLTPGPTAGLRIELVAPPAGVAQPLDGVPEADEPVPPDEVWVRVLGNADPAAVELVELGTGAVQPAAPASGTPGSSPHARFTDVRGAGVRVARLRAGGGTYVSRPLLAAPGRGVVRTLTDSNRPVARCRYLLERKLDDLAGRVRCEVLGLGGAPRRFETGDVRLPLPAHAQGVALDGAPARAAVEGGELVWRGPLPPGHTELEARFGLPVEAGRATFAITPTQALFQADAVVERGATTEIVDLVGATGPASVEAPDAGGEYHRIGASGVAAGGTFGFGITGLRRRTPCEELHPTFTGHERPHPAPDLEAELVDGPKVALRSLRGRVLVLNLWASWCPPCHEELPSLGRLARGLDRERALVLGLASDASWDDVRRVAGRTPEITVWLDRPASTAAGALGTLAQKLGTSKLPETYLV